MRKLLLYRSINKCLFFAGDGNELAQVMLRAGCELMRELKIVLGELWNGLLSKSSY